MIKDSIAQQINKSYYEYYDEYHVYPDTIYLTKNQIYDMQHETYEFSPCGQDKLGKCMGMRIIELDSFEYGKARRGGNLTPPPKRLSLMPNFIIS